MKNCLILGVGRSGTSLMGGILHQAGYYMGDSLYPPRHSNPKGFFECDFINRINENILNSYDITQSRSYIFSEEKERSPLNPGYGQRWLSFIPANQSIHSNDNQIDINIRHAIEKKPFAYKDPRFNYTIHVWDQYLDNEAVYICMFREPGITIQSILKECSGVEYLSNFFIDPYWAEHIWINSYNHLLKNLTTLNRSILFVHYQQLIKGEIILKISDLLHCKLNNDFISKELNRTQNRTIVSSETLSIYDDLCKLADY
ncbi:MAG TPA: sulfotransferase [Prolixibacteraceae bacterium]|nr:sulfotransferase [Prolixibacteraceae bacterium]